MNYYDEKPKTMEDKSRDIPWRKATKDRKTLRELYSAAIKLEKNEGLDEANWKLFTQIGDVSFEDRQKMSNSDLGYLAEREQLISGLKEARNEKKRALIEAEVYSKRLADKNLAKKIEKEKATMTAGEEININQQIESKLASVANEYGN